MRDTIRQWWGYKFGHTSLVIQVCASRIPCSSPWGWPIDCTVLQHCFCCLLLFYTCSDGHTYFPAGTLALKMKLNQRWTNLKTLLIESQVFAGICLWTYLRQVWRQYAWSDRHNMTLFKCVCHLIHCWCWGCDVWLLSYYICDKGLLKMQPWFVFWQECTWSSLQFVRTRTPGLKITNTLYEHKQ